MKKAHLAALLIMLLFGSVKVGFEQKLTEEHRASFFHGAKLDLNMRQQLGQLSFLAALSGFRSVVADLLWFEAHSAWERTEWGRMALLFNNVTALEPRNVMFWDMSAWHMGYNASISAHNNRKEPREAVRIKAQREYFEVGKDFLLRGIQNNPDRYKLYDSLANLYKDKFQDHEKAAYYFEKASQFQDSPSYEKRMAAYELSYCPDREREAYEMLVKFYKLGDNEHLPTLLTRLKFLQEKLNIPADERVYNPPEK